MPRLLRDKDLSKVTKSDSLQELITEYRNEWLDSEQVAQAEMISKLTQRYNMTKVFTNTTVWDSLLVYKAKNLIEYTAAEFNETTAYVVANRVLYNGKIYACTVNSTGFLPTNKTYWTYLVDDKTLYFGLTPNTEFNIETTYAIGNVVFYNDVNYTALKPSKGILPGSNTSVWGSGVAYSIPANTLPTNTAYWTLGDNRNPLLIRFLLDMTRYHFERSIPARNVSDLIKEAYNGNGANELGGAIGWLKRVAAGTDNADLPKIIPTQGLSIQYGDSSTDTRPYKNQLW